MASPKRTFSALTPAQQELAAEYESTARRLACQAYYQSGRFGDVEDYIETGYFALIAAVAHFNPDLGYCFDTLLGLALKRRLWGLRAELARKKRVRRCARFCEIERDDMPLFNPADRRSYEPGRSVAIAEILARVEKGLSRQQYDLLHARFVEGEPVRTMGIRLGVKMQSVRDEIDAALEQARRLVRA